ncbi:hypothetical protein DSO57_1002813 [Entomophthora muscae]|uniref:Uncharacterized protein n=1 Tax=Entomophthora muscae TaxID=34485 RepID=A0ACC2SAR7_9FUNG|nr:hypothetical protein DSO57_1002813 [Entomophthora muscae]
MDINYYLPPLQNIAHPVRVHLPALKDVLNSLHVLPVPASPPKVNPYTLPQRTANFVNIVGKAFQKRYRRKYNEVNRIYPCSFHGCNKAYGALNHLNAHIISLKHGPRRSARDFQRFH